MMTKFPVKQSLWLPSALVAAACFLAPATVRAAGAVLMQGASVTITKEDVIADAKMRIPTEMQGAALSKPAAVTQIVSYLYVRRAMAKLAQEQGMGEDPVVVAALEVARDKVLSDVYLAKLDSQNAVSDAAAEAFARNIYQAKPSRFALGERVHVRHILIAGKEGESRAQAERVLEELKGGADFAAIARDRSADKSSGEKGGDLGVFEAGRMVPEFDVAAFALKNPGDLSGVVETQFGYHILQLQARMPPGRKPFEEVRDELVAEVRAEAAQKARIAAADKLRGDIKVNEQAVEALSAGYR